MLKYNSLAIALVVGAHFLCICKLRPLPLSEVEDMEAKEDRQTDLFSAKDLLLGNPQVVARDKVLRAEEEAMRCLLRIHTTGEKINAKTENLHLKMQKNSTKK